MLIMTRDINGAGRFDYPWSDWHPGAVQIRPGCGRVSQPGMAPVPYNMSGPSYKGMDPSDPLTYSRPWNPQPGMVARLNFDGAQMQGRTPTQLQRGSQARRRGIRRLRVSP